MILDQLIEELSTKIRDRVLTKWGHAIENPTVSIPPRMEMGTSAGRISQGSLSWSVGTQVTANSPATSALIVKAVCLGK